MKIKLLPIIFVGALVSACAWGPGSNMDETRDQILTVARKTEAVDFNQFNSFAITDSVTVVNDGKKTRLSNDTTDLIIAQVVRNMNMNGYTQVQVDENPDLLVDLAYIQRTNTYMYPGYWNDWDWWWNYNYFPWFGWDSYYPYQMPVFISSYTTGSLVIEVADVVNVATEASVPVVWHGLIREILNGKHTQQELVSAIDEVFTILPPK
ncbi:MAG: DUF4136 domain-containing protein [Bacteroidales bacterium]|nr:DUF4136 domain-containing protein [Bacteroidales bacterium]MBQ8646253.1 DUF4136 domain-containing protein [Bacteroidales bacterium]